MPVKTLKTLELQTLSQWRTWLIQHHESESHVWLIFYKIHTGKPSISYNDAVEEALCFGWIDSLVHRLDDQRYARKFTPRRPGSRWSAPNRKRYAALQSSGRLKPAGLKVAPPDDGSDPDWPPVDPPAYIRKAFQSNAAAWKFFNTLAPSYRRRYIGWIDSAKQPETKSRRIKTTIKLLVAGHKPVM